RDVRGEAGGIAIDVLAVARRDGERPRGGAVGDSDVGMGGVDGGNPFVRSRQRRREQVAGAGALGDGGGGEVDGGRGDGVEHVGGGGAAADGSSLARPACDVRDVRGEAGGVAIDVLAVAGGNGERPGGGAVGDG